MIAPFVLIPTLGKSHVELRPTSDRPNGVFAEAPDGAGAVWIDGRDTGVRAPEGIRFEEASNGRGDITGNFLQDWSSYSKDQEAYRLVTRNYPFVRPRYGKFQWLPLPPKAVNPRVIGIDGRGNVLAIDAPYRTEPIENDPKGFCHAYLRQGRRWLDIGAADTASIEPDGTVRGVYSVDRSGNPVYVPKTDAAVARRARFVWRNGRRTNLR